MKLVKTAVLAASALALAVGSAWAQDKPKEKSTMGNATRSDESGFSNLFLAGTWLRTGLNVSCVEAAVMSGMQCARAISGSPHEIVGEYFLQRPPAPTPAS